MRTISFAFILASLSIAAPARQPDAFDACAHESDPAARLACFDRQTTARGMPDAAPKASPSGKETAVAPAPAASVATASAAPAAAAAATSTATAAAKPATPVSATTASAGADRDVGLDARQLHRERRERGEAEPAPPPPIVARVLRVIPRGPHISAFELDNGQVWEQSEAEKFSVSPNEQITIRPGLLGAFFLKGADGNSVRAHRLR